MPGTKTTVHILSDDGSETIRTDQQTAQLIHQVMDRADAAEALDYVLATPVGGPSCSCGADHWSCSEPLDGGDDA